MGLDDVENSGSKGSEKMHPRMNNEEMLEFLKSLEIKPDPERWQRMLDTLAEANVRVEKVHEDTFPLTVSDEGFESLPYNEQRLRFLGLVASCRRFWGGYNVVEPFGLDDKARVAFQERMRRSFYPEYDQLQLQSRLRNGVQTGLFLMFKGLVADADKYGIASPQLDKLRKIFAALPQIGDVSRHYYAYEITDEERFLMLREFDTAAKEFLTMVTPAREE
jgi:hypothetical protein